MAEMAPIMSCYGVSLRVGLKEVLVVQLVEAEENRQIQVHLIPKSVFLSFHALMLASLLKRD